MGNKRKNAQRCIYHNPDGTSIPAEIVNENPDGTVNLCCHGLTVYDLTHVSRCDITMGQYRIKPTNRDQIRPGDIILCDDGRMRTVGEKDISYDSFMGVSIFGDSYKFGYMPVKKVTDLEFNVEEDIIHDIASNRYLDLDNEDVFDRE